MPLGGPARLCIRVAICHTTLVFLWKCCRASGFITTHPFSNRIEIELFVRSCRLTQNKFDFGTHSMRSGDQWFINGRFPVEQIAIRPSECHGWLMEECVKLIYYELVNFNVAFRDFVSIQDTALWTRSKLDYNSSSYPALGYFDRPYCAKAQLWLTMGGTSAKEQKSKNLDLKLHFADEKQLSSRWRWKEKWKIILMIFSPKSEENRNQRNIHAFEWES